MRIGILSMQKIPNYGSFLQAFSLKKQFEKRGHEAYFIDIEKGRQIVKSKTESSSILLKLDRYALTRLKNYFFYRKMIKIHQNDYLTFLNTQKRLPEGEMFDVVLIGSDEVFNAAVPSAWGFTPQLFGKVDCAKHVVSYAASCGQTTAEIVKNLNVDKEICDAMSRLELISVRDDNTYDFVVSLTNREPLKNIDPVFLTDYSEYIPKTTWKKPYMLVYAYGNRIDDENEIHAIKAYAKEEKIDILCVGMQQRWCKNNITASAFELLSYVKNAACIVTDTFHGTVFSIKYNKQFVSIIRDSNRNKLTDLLKNFDLCDREVTQSRELPSKMKAAIDYNKVNEILTTKQDEAFACLGEICERGAL